MLKREIERVETTAAKKIKQARENNRLTQDQLAQLIGASVWTIRGYEQAKSVPDLDALTRISHFTGYPVHWFLQVETGGGDSSQKELPPIIQEAFEMREAVLSVKKHIDKAHEALKRLADGVASAKIPVIGGLPMRDGTDLAIQRKAIDAPANTPDGAVAYEILEDYPNFGYSKGSYVIALKGAETEGRKRAVVKDGDLFTIEALPTTKEIVAVIIAQHLPE